MNKVSVSINNLRQLEKEHTDMGMEILKGADGAIYPMDILAIAVLNRSVCLLSGFSDLIEKKNFTSAAPLVRLQLDNLLRFHAAWLVEKPHDFATKIINGEKVRDLKDKNGKKMTDTFLLEKISIEYQKLKKIYEDTSGFIHLSDKHIFSSLGKVKDNGKFNMKIGSTDDFVSEDEYLMAIRVFYEITGILFRYFKGWSVAKNNK